MRLPNFDYTITHNKKDSEDIDALMKRLGEVVRKHRLLLKPFFQDKDISKIGRVSFSRMRSILDNTKIPLTDHQYQLLCQNFAYDQDEFNYVDFIEVLKQYEQENWEITDRKTTFCVHDFINLFLSVVFFISFFNKFRIKSIMLKKTNWWVN